MTGPGPRSRPGGPPRGGLTPTRPGNLVLAAVGTAAVAFIFIRRYFGDLPDITWLAGLTMAGLAVVEAIAAHNTRARIERRPRAGVLNPLFVARLAVLAMNYGETYSVADRFITQLDVRLTAFGYDPEQAVARRYGIEGLPVSYFIDADGVVARVITGQLTPALIEAGMAAAEGRVSD